MRLLISTVMFFICALAFAGDFDVVTLKISPVSTNATVSQDIGEKITGYIERADIVCGVSTSVPWVKIFASNVLSGKLTTLFTEVQIATNITYSPHILYNEVSGSAMGTNFSSGRIALYDEYIYLVATNATVGATDQTIKAFITYEAK